MAYQPQINNKAVNIITGLLDYIDTNASKYVTKSSDNTFTVATNIPSAAFVRESAIINSNINNVWNAIKPATFDFLSAVKSTNKSASDIVSNTLTVNYNDGTSQTIQITEISFLDRSISYSVISSTPAVSYSSANHQIKLIEVTTNNQTYIEWSTDFSNDATLSVIRDSRFKKKEAFQDLTDFLSIKITNDLEEKKEEISSQLLKVSIEKTTDVNIDKLWKILSDFGNVSYSKMVETCVTTNDGQIRNITIKNNGGQLSEKLTVVNKNAYSLGYTIVKNTALPVQNYNSVVKLVKTDNKGCKIVWKSSFNSKDVADSLAQATIKEVLQGTIDAMIAFAKK